MIRVIYVDDEEELLEIGKIFLERNGELNVDIVTSVKEATRPWQGPTTTPSSPTTRCLGKMGFNI
jgi:DNA-binding NtrC family response regulator